MASVLKRVQLSVRARYAEWVMRFLHRTFTFWQRLGIHALPNHFYSPIPDTRMFDDNFWSHQSDLVGVAINDELQQDLVATFAAHYRAEYEQLPRFKTRTPYEYYVNNGAFESVDGEMLYCMIRHVKPRRIVEIGSGNSTYLMAQAIRVNKQTDGAYDCELIAIEPHPNRILQAGFPGLTMLIPKRVQDVALEKFCNLQENDILFIDSSHILSVGSDVQYEFLEILPRLKPGVLVHVHDIFLPAPYRKETIVRDYRFFNEQYVLQAFLAFNDAFSVLWAGSHMHLQYPDLLEQHFSTYNRLTRWPGSFWMKRVK